MEHLKKYWYLIIAVFVIFMFVNHSVCLLILGFLFIYVSISALVFLNKIQKIGIKCQGRLLKFEYDYEGYKMPIIEFHTLDNVFIKGKPYVSVSTNLGLFNSLKKRIDKLIPILYSPEDPSKFVIESHEKQNYMGYIFFTLIGIGIFILGIFEIIEFTTIFE